MDIVDVDVPMYVVRWMIKYNRCCLADDRDSKGKERGKKIRRGFWPTDIKGGYIKWNQIIMTTARRSTDDFM